MSTSDLPRPEPVTRAGVIAGAVAGLIITLGGLARALGWLTDDLDVNAVATQASNLILGAGVLWSTVAPLVLALWARSKVTPLSSPRDATGKPLAAETRVVLVDDIAAAGRPRPYPSPAPTDPTPTTVMPAVLRAVPTPRRKPLPIEAEALAALTDTVPAMPAVLG